jgi:hypothetical protein
VNHCCGNCIFYRCISVTFTLNGERVRAECQKFHDSVQPQDLCDYWTSEKEQDADHD